MTNNLTTMTEIDYTLLNGHKTPVSFADNIIALHRDTGSVCIIKDQVQHIIDTGITIEIRTKGAVINLYKNVNFFTTTIL